MKSSMLSSSSPAKWSDPDFEPFEESSLYPDKSAVDPQDELTIDIFSRLTAPNMIYGPAFKSESTVLALPMDSASMAANMLQGQPCQHCT